MHALAAAHELRLDAVIDQLLQDFLQVCPDDYSSQFVSECLPLLFNIFRYSKVRRLPTFYMHYCAFFVLHFYVILNAFTEGRHYAAVGRYIYHVLWLGIYKTDKRTGFTTGERLTN